MDSTIQDKLTEKIQFYKERAAELEADAADKHDGYLEGITHGWASCYKAVANQLEKLLEGNKYE